MLQIRDEKQPATREFFTSTNAQAEGVILSSDFVCIHQTSDTVSSCFLPHYISLLSHFPSCVYLYSAEIKDVDSQVLGLNVWTTTTCPLVI